MESIPTSPRSVMFNDFHIDGGGTSIYKDEMIQSKIQSILDESIVQQLISTVSSETSSRFTYHMVEEMTDGDIVAQPNLVITGDKGPISLGTLHVNLGKGLRPSSPPTPMIEACIRVEDMVGELLDSLRGTPSRVAPPPSKDSSEALERSRALTDRVARLEAENTALRRNLSDYENSTQKNAEQLGEVIAEYDSVSAENKALTAENTQLRDEVESLKALGMKVMDISKRFEAENTSLKSRVADLTDALAKSKVDKAQLQARVDAHAPAVDALNARITLLEGQVQDQTALQTRVREQEDELAALRAQNLVPKANFDAQAARVKKLEAELAANAELIAISAKTKKTLETTKKQSRSYRQMMEQYRTQLDEQKIAIARLDDTLRKKEALNIAQHEAHTQTLRSLHSRLEKIDPTSHNKLATVVALTVRDLTAYI